MIEREAGSRSGTNGGRFFPGGGEFHEWARMVNWGDLGVRAWNRIKQGWSSLTWLISRVARLFTRKTLSLDALHQRLLADPSLKWERTALGCHSRAVIIVEELRKAGIPAQQLEKIWLVHRDKINGGTFSVQTRAGSMEHWGEHIAVAVMTPAGRRVIDPALFDSPVDLQTWLNQFPAIEAAGAPPTPEYVNRLLEAADDQFEALMKRAAHDPNRIRHLLNNVELASRAAAFGINVERWVQSQAPLSEPGFDHLASLPRRAHQAGALVQGEIVWIQWDIDPFPDFFWDSIDGGRLRGTEAARAFLRDL